jgi:hypothetical protein
LAGQKPFLVKVAQSVISSNAVYRCDSKERGGERGVVNLRLLRQSTRFRELDDLRLSLFIFGDRPRAQRAIYPGGGAEYLHSGLFL